MQYSLTSEEYARVHRSTIGNFEINSVHESALRRAGAVGSRKILDIGCGNGELLYLLKKNGAEIYGVDFDAKSAEVARAKTGEAENIKIANVAALPYQEKYFDLVFSLGTLGYLSENDLGKASGEIFRILKPGGEAIIRTATKNNKVGTFLLKIKHKNYETNTNFHGAGTFTQTFKKSGFKVLKIERSLDSQTKSGLKKIILGALKPFLASTWIHLKK